MKSAIRSYLALIEINLLLAVREKVVLFFNFLFPLIFFFVFGQMMDASRGGVGVRVVSMVLVLGVLGNGLFGAGARTVHRHGPDPWQVEHGSELMAASQGPRPAAEPWRGSHRGFAMGPPVGVADGGSGLSQARQGNARGAASGPGSSEFVKLMVAFLTIVILLSATFAGVAVVFIGERVLEEARNRISSELNSAQEMYKSTSGGLHDLIGYQADRFYLREALVSGDLESAAGELHRVMTAEDLDFLSVTDETGRVLLRAAYPDRVGDSQAEQAIVAAALSEETPVVGNAVLGADELGRESPGLPDIARLELVATPAARPLCPVPHCGQRKPSCRK